MSIGIDFSRELDRLPWEYPQAMMTRDEVEFLYYECLRVRPKFVLELGTGFGYSTRAFGFGVLDYGGRVVSVDNRSGAPNQFGWEGINKAILDLGLPVSFIVSDSLAFNPLLPVDLLFIDTSHTYEQTRAELDRFASLMSKCGEIFLHDVMQGPPVGPDETRAIMDFLRSNREWRYEVALNTENGIGRLFR